MEAQRGQTKIHKIVKGCAGKEDEICRDESKVREFESKVSEEIRKDSFHKLLSLFSNDQVQVRVKAKVSCCQGDLCNSGGSLKNSLFLFAVSIVAFVVFML